ncbi:MAG: protein phosphatase 2C domain-containing protein [Thermodesulfobacteriota bacterium]
MKPVAHFSTDQGHCRETNEDAYFDASHLPWDLTDSNGYLYAVADGMGGVAGGGIASNITVKALQEYYEKCRKHDLRRLPWKEWATQTISELTNRINHYLAAGSYFNPDIPTDLGTTLVGIAIFKEEAVGFNIGDSRLYHFSIQKGFYQVSKDHNKARELLDEGKITSDGARNHPDSHVLTHWLGGRSRMGVCQPDIFPLQLCPGEMLLLCSDGLSGLVPDTEMAQCLLLHGNDLKKITDDLISKALSAGGYDNITVGIIQLRPDEEEGHGKSEDRSHLVRLAG